jgi:hypothetical protein
MISTAHTPRYTSTPMYDCSLTYSSWTQTTGALVQDHDAPFCLRSASLAANPRRRDAIARAPLPTCPLNSVRGVKDSAAHRSYLKKRRVIPVHAL